MSKDLTRLQNSPPWDWPKTAAETLTNILQDHRTPPVDRVIAAALAGNVVVMDDRMAQQLLNLLRDPNEPETLRAQAAISLGPALEDADTQGFDDEWAEPVITQPVFEQVQTTLRDIHLDPSLPKLVRRRALEAAVRAPQDWHTDAIREAHAASDPEWNLTAAFCMRWIRGFDQQILELLQSPDPEIRCEAVQAAGNWSILPAWPHIAAILTSRKPDTDLLLAAIAAAASFRMDEARDLLGDLVDSDDEQISEAASDALLELEDGAFDDDDDDDDDEDDDEDKPAF
jgi:uncharacterized protein (UPF0147 family)